MRQHKQKHEKESCVQIKAQLWAINFTSELQLPCSYEAFLFIQGGGFESCGDSWWSKLLLDFNGPLVETQLCCWGPFSGNIDKFVSLICIHSYAQAQLMILLGQKAQLINTRDSF